MKLLLSKAIATYVPVCRKPGASTRNSVRGLALTLSAQVSVWTPLPLTKCRSPSDRVNDRCLGETNGKQPARRAYAPAVCCIYPVRPRHRDARMARCILLVSSYCFSLAAPVRIEAAAVADPPW